jgi:DNA anti-recombination protein RmuC
LEEAKEIAERGKMNLYMADYHLEAARLCLAESENDEYRVSNTEFQMTKLKEARIHCEEAAKRVKDMGYHRRDPEVLLIQAEIELTEGNKKQAKEMLKTAERRINEMGCHRWDIELERLKRPPTTGVGAK